MVIWGFGTRGVWDSFRIGGDAPGAGVIEGRRQQQEGAIVEAAEDGEVACGLELNRSRASPCGVGISSAGLASLISKNETRPAHAALLPQVVAEVGLDLGRRARLRYTMQQRPALLYFVPAANKVPVVPKAQHCCFYRRLTS